MTIRSDVRQDFSQSPRVSTVESPSVEFIVQDVVDTLRKIETSFRGSAEKKLLNASGKEDLGGGVSVGITLALQNNLIAFEGRTVAAQIGIITTTDAVPANATLKVYDTAATFITNNIQPGSLVINYTDESIAEVVKVTSETELWTKIPVNGITNTYTLNDKFNVFNVIQCEVSGGNLVAVDTNGDSISPILPTAFTQVVRSASSSATSQNIIDIQHSSYSDGITIDAINGKTAASGATGTGREPFNNLADALVEDIVRNFKRLYIRGNYTFGATDVVDGYDIFGQGVGRSLLTFTTGCSTDNVKFFNTNITGTVDGSISATKCDIINLSGIGDSVGDMFFTDCTIDGILSLRSDNTVSTHFHECRSGVPGATTPTLDINGANTNFDFRGYVGGIKIINNTANSNVSLDVLSGHVILDTTITNGNFVVRGTGKLTDNSTGSAIVDSEYLVQAGKLPDQLWGYSATTVLPGSFGEILRTSTFAGQIRIDVNNGIAGTSFPIGTHSVPSNNFTDALVISAVESIDILVIAEDAIVGPTDDISGKTIIGAHALKSEVILLAGCNTTFTQFKECNLTGTANGPIVVRQSKVEDLLDFQGVMHQTLIAGELRVTGTQPSQLLNCYSSAEVLKSPEINMNGSATGLGVSQHDGALKITNLTSVEDMNIGMAGGIITIDGTVTAGDFELYGNAHVINNSTGTTINDIGLINEDVRIVQVSVNNLSAVVNLLRKYQENRTVIDENTFTMTIYDDDNVTPIHVFDLKDENGVASITQIFERIPQ